MMKEKGKYFAIVQGVPFLTVIKEAEELIEEGYEILNTTACLYNDRIHHIVHLVHKDYKNKS